ncbi:L,D-transpeptidase [Leifsonia sp. NPDC014704]|uniref:L,D-transpeptidase n=1 Tax=Leifsonia sp. NPDC014704 TaxID=3364123 RepID=UPI0036F47CED
MTGETGQKRDSGVPRSRRRSSAAIAAGVVVAGVAALAAVVLIEPSAGILSGSAQQANAGTGAVVSADYTEPTPDEIAALPEARYDAVIPGLMAYTSAKVPAVSRDVYVISTDTAIFDSAKRPVARFAFRNFAGRPTVIVPVEIDGPWALVMTPARQRLPSQAGGSAPAQTAGWVRTSSLKKAAPEPLERHVVIAASSQTLAIQEFDGTTLQSFGVAVGASGTPTPTGVTGYLQERYLDPEQGQTTYPIELTSLHSSAQDEPFRGEDGGLIGMHYFPSHDGTVSHGCIRLSAEAITAVNRLPLGTSVTIVP